MKFLRIEKSLTSAENVVLTIVNRREGATLLNCDECHSIEVRASDLRGLIGWGIPGHLSVVDEIALSLLEDMAESTRAIEHSLDRRYRIQAKDLEHAVEDGQRAIQTLADEIPGQIRDALREHVADCPLRTPKEQP